MGLLQCLEENIPNEYYAWMWRINMAQKMLKPLE